MKTLLLTLICCTAMAGQENHRYMILGVNSVTDSHWQMMRATGIHNISMATAVKNCAGTKVLISYDQAGLASCAPCAAAVQNAINLGVPQMTASEARAFIRDPVNNFVECDE